MTAAIVFIKKLSVNGVIEFATLFILRPGQTCGDGLTAAGGIKVLGGGRVAANNSRTFWTGYGVNETLSGTGVSLARLTFIYSRSLFHSHSVCQASF